jgi:hypothetical protein
MLTAMKLDNRRIVEYFGGVADLSAALVSLGYSAPYATVEKWRQRTSLSAERIEQLQALARRQGRAFNPEQFQVAD